MKKIADDFDQKPLQGDDNIIRINHVLPNVDIEEISDGEFNLDYLKKYKHTRELYESIKEALLELGDKPYQGRQSCARVMGRSMELLRETYRLDAPRGWVPIMRHLREVEGRGPASERASALESERASAQENEASRPAPDEL